MSDNVFKKGSSIDGSYQPSEVEKAWPQFWEDTKCFVADVDTARNAVADKKFVMVIPPPNVTGSLHLGHTMMAAIEDTLTRWHRMCGKATLWLPGTDHAGIATQSVVERSLSKNQGLSRHDLGREQFVKRTLEWKDQYGPRILYQLRRLGCSCDWSREAFTLSPSLSKAVTNTFVTLFDRGLIYRDERLVSWCPYLQTALSDIEVDILEIEKPERLRVPGFERTVEVGCLWHFKYALKNQPGRFIEVATTRLETMLGDTAVAVNPNDVRYQDIIGEQLVHPFVADRQMFIIADEHCDPAFGTGAVKITPAHDKNDYEVGKRHNLTSVTVFTLDGKINDQGGQFAGLHRFEARVQIEKALENLELLGEKKPNTKKMSLPQCSRSGDIIEFMLLPQWWVDCSSMGARAADAVRLGDLKLLPKGSDKQWFYWMDNIRDWCISRQLWWGHQIPAYLCVNPDTKEAIKRFEPHRGLHSEVWIAAHDESEAYQKAKKLLGNDQPFELQRDPDVLDTWFSSGLFPFSSLGWPDLNAKDLEAFFPTTLLETGGDILFFWVARMVMLSLELIGKLPFHTVYLHPMVRDAHGKKMSKSLGNVVDPIDVIQGITLEKMSQAIRDSNLKETEIKRALDAQKKDFPNGIEECGADALRFGLLTYLRGNQGINLDINRVIGYKHFCNKLWNASKFVMSYLKAAECLRFKPDWSIVTGGQLFWIDQWILHRSSICASKTNSALLAYNFEAATNAIYTHWLTEFCDIYLELVKPRVAILLSSDRTDRNIDLQHTTTLQCMFIVLERALRLSHPMLPFVTEELWQRFVNFSRQTGSTQYYPRSISLTDYPLQVFSWQNETFDMQMEIFMDIVRRFRSMLAQFEVQPKNKLEGFVRVSTSSSALTNFISERLGDIEVLSKMKKISIQTHFADDWVTDIVNDKVHCALKPEGCIDFAKVALKFEKRLGVISKQIIQLETKLNATDYQIKVPQNIRDRNSESLQNAKAEEATIEKALNSVRKCLGQQASINVESLPSIEQQEAFQ